MNIKKVVILIVLFFVIFWLITFTIDYYRCSHLQMPIFTFNGIRDDIGYSTGQEDFSYYGILYKVYYSTIPNSQGDKQINHIQMYIFNKCIINLKNEC